MARQDALLRLHKTLLARRDELRAKLSDELASLRGDTNTADPADAAFEAVGDEMASALAEFDARELTQIQRALARLKAGTYGLCENCGEKIPVARLNALPYTPYCIECQRELERYPDYSRTSHGDNWEHVHEVASLMEEPREVKLSDLEIDLSHS